jgi:hypothetical protein
MGMNAPGSGIKLGGKNFTAREVINAFGKK